MSKVNAPLSIYAPIREERTRTVVSYDLQPAVPGTSPSGMATWHEIYFNKNQGVPGLEQVKQAVIADINARTDQRILSGFTWEGKPVWLSRENEFNFKAAYDLALQTEGANLPLKFKLGEEEDGTPIYHTFRSMNALQDFYMSAIAYIQQCLADGWQLKDSIDWSPYAPAEAAVPDGSPSGQ